MLGREVTHITGERLLPCRGHSVYCKGVVQYYIHEVLSLNKLNESLSATLTCVFDGQMGDQELLFRGGVFTVVTLEGSVVGVGQLVVEQQLLVVAIEIAELTLEPGTGTSKRYSL